MRNRETVLKYVRLSIVTAITTVLLMLFFVAYLMAPIWRTIRGSTVTVSNWRLTIPKGYSAWSSDSLFTFGFGAPLLNDNYAHISVFTKPARPDLTPQQIENAIVTIAQQDGYVLEGRKTVVSGSETNYCFRFSEQPRNSKVIIRCMNNSGELSVYFEGDQRFGSDVYSVLIGAEKIKY